MFVYILHILLLIIINNKFLINNARMFTGFKDKLLNVNHLFVTEDSANNPKSLFNPRAGAIILQHFQDRWVEIHGLNEENASGADTVAEEIAKIVQKVARNKSDIELIDHLLASSNLIDSISDCLKKTKNLFSECQKVEGKLVDLEVLLEDLEFDKMAKKHSLHLDNYKVRKQESLKKLEKTLEEQYESKLAEHEKSKKSLLEERQKVFQEAFKSDLETYKSLGTIPKVELSPRNRNGAILEEIQLDFDQKELEQFFNEAS